MELIEELQNTNTQAFDKWFDRWFEKNDFPNIFKNAAQQGYSGFSIKLANSTPLSEQDKYLNRRLRDPRTVTKLKEKLPEISIKFTKEEKTGFFGIRYTVEELVFNWE